MRFDKKSTSKTDKKNLPKAHKKGVVGYNKKTALLEEAITHMNAGKYGRSSAVLKELLALDPLNTEARRLFATLHLRLGSLISARTAFESLANLATKAGVEGAGRFKVHAPLLKMTKAEIIREGVRLGVDYALTHSCYDPEGDLACGRCDACHIRAQGFNAAGVPDPTRYVRRT